MMKLIYVYSRSQTRPSQPKTSIANPKARPIILQSPESKLLGRVNQKKRAKGMISHADNQPKEKRKSNLKRPASEERRFDVKGKLSCSNTFLTFPLVILLFLLLSQKGDLSV